MTRAPGIGGATRALVLGAVLWLGLPVEARADDFKLLTKQKKIYLAIGSGAALPYHRVVKGKPLRIEVEGPRKLPLEARCVVGKKSRKSRAVACRLRVRLGGRVLGRLNVRGETDPEASFQDVRGQRPSVPGSLDMDVPKGIHVLIVDVLRSKAGGVAVWIGQAPAEPVGEMLPMVPLAPVSAKPPAVKPKEKPAGKEPEGDIELVPLVVPELASEKTEPEEATPGVAKRAGPETARPELETEPGPAERRAAGESGGERRAAAEVVKPEPEADAILALGPRVGVLLPLGGVGGEPTWLIGAEVRLLVPGTSEMLAVGVGVEYYPIETRGTQGHTDFVLNTWTLPITASATFTPLPDTVVSPVVGAGLGAYIGATRLKDSRGRTDESGVSAAFGFFLMGALEVDLGAGGGLLAEVRWARAKGDLGDMVENADLGGLTVDLRYRYLF